MAFTWTKRLALGVGALGTTAALVAAASFALFTSAAAPQMDTFAAGTVILGTTASTTCNVTNMEPGDSSAGYAGANSANLDNNGMDKACSYTIQYSGSLPAWIGLSLGVNSVSAAAYTPQGSATQLGGAALYDGTTNGLQVALSSTADPNQTFALPAVTCTSQTVSVTGATYSPPNNQQTCASPTSPAMLVLGATPTSTSPYACTVTATVNSDCSVNGPANGNPGWTDTFNLNYWLPLAATNAYQGGSATFTLTARAVQESNNPLNASNQPSEGWHQMPQSAP